MIIRPRYRQILLSLLALCSLAGCLGSPPLPPINPSATVALPTAALPGATATVGATLPPTPTEAPATPTLTEASPPSPTPVAPTATPEAILPTLPPSPSATPPPARIRTVFIIVMENHNWSQIVDNPSAPYLNNTLLPASSYATQYYNPPGIHPSEPNYLWLEAGTNFGIANDNPPSANHLATTQHLVTLLTAHGLSWKAYQEDISGTRCPLTASGLYAPKHNPMVFFDDVTDHNSPTAAYCIAHERPYSELAGDLAANTVADYNFIAPDLCNDMHNSSGCATPNSVRNGDTWLAGAVPPILRSAAYQAGGVLFITWDEGEGGDGPIGLLALSPLAKGHGYASTIHYTHSALLRTVQEILGVTPLLGAAAGSPDLSDLFAQVPW